MYSATDQRSLYDLSKKLLAGHPADLFAQDDAQRADDLGRVLRYHEWRYYVQNDPVLSDYEYDLLYKQLEQLEAERPDLVSPDSPTQRVGKDLTETFAQVSHLTPMLSLDNSYDATDLLDFDKLVESYRAKLLAGEVPEVPATAGASAEAKEAIVQAARTAEPPPKPATVAPDALPE
ncbi:MAG TPA: hypothetical protein PK858_06610, partial [Saprospiraceae bacterium]|nr:hypothetical protein [Saprospiraceae bacterium]